MKIHVRLFGREVLAVEAEHAPPSQVEQQAQPEPQPAPELAIPAGFGFHGGAGGSQQTTWQPVTDRPIVVDRSQSMEWRR